jgi:GNAT superfamily N-acetyltransferase
MLFASTQLAARIERAERSLIAAGVEACARRRPEVEVLMAPLAGGLAAWSGESSPFNKVVGAGFEGPLDETALAEVEGELSRRGAPVQFELSCLADPSIAASLTRRGYVLLGFENVLGRALEPERSPSSVLGIDDSLSPREELDAWLDVVITGFASPDTQGVASSESFPREVLKETHADMAAADGFVCFAARREGRLAGGASMRMTDGVAQLCGAATLPEHRRRGVQTALLEHRLGVAAAAGCELAIVTTQPGSKSQENVQRRGFELLYTRAVLVLAP